MKEQVKKAATVVLLRNTGEGLVVLLLKRNPSLNVLGGYWVFPGGSLDISDQGITLDEQLRSAAVRETAEESGVCIKNTALTHFSRWVTPEGIPKRFDTYFYCAEASSGKVVIDEQEIVDYQWVSIEQAIHSHHVGHFQMMPPTLITLIKLSAFNDMSSLRQALLNHPLQVYLPKIAGGESLCMLYQDDFMYDVQSSQKGEKHRCVWVEERWQYIDERKYRPL